MEKFLVSLKFALNIYIIATFITLLILGIINIIKKVTEKNN
jgi:hypothetical protein